MKSQRHLGGAGLVKAHTIQTLLPSAIRIRVERTGSKATLHYEEDFPRKNEPHLRASAQMVARALGPQFACTVVRGRRCATARQGSVPDAPARVVGTSNLSDGNVLTTPEASLTKVARRRRPSGRPRASDLDAPAGVVTASENGNGNEPVVSSATRMSAPSHPDRPARTVRAGAHGQQTMVEVPHHPPSDLDEPSRTVRASSSGTPDKILACGAHRPSVADAPARTLTANEFSDGALLANARHPISEPDAPSRTVCTKGDMQGGQGAALLAWPWDRPATVVTPRETLAPPGHHPETFSNMSLPNAVKLSERAAAILQGFPERWVFEGKTKSSRWAQIGMAMPPPLAAAVGRSIARHMGLEPAAQATASERAR